MPGCDEALNAIAGEVNGNRDTVRQWIDGGWFRWLSGPGPLARELPGASWKELDSELRALPRSVLPILIDAADLAVRSGKQVEFRAPGISKESEAEFRAGKKVRIELDYDSEKISVKIYHLGAAHQDRWYAAAGSRSPAFSHMFA